MIHVSQLGEDFFLYDQASQSLIGQNRGQSFSLGDEVKIQVAGVNLEERKIDFQLIQQLTHLGRVIRQKAPRTANSSSSNRASTTEEVFGKAPSSTKAKVSEGGEKPVRKKKDKNKPSSYTKKPAKKASAKPETKEKAKKKVKKKKSNAKAKTE
jgi:ribonuclease R